jgi:hypothetical protein
VTNEAAAGHLLAREACEDVDPAADGGDVVDHGRFELRRPPAGRFGRFELQRGDQVAVDLLLPLDQQGHVDFALRAPHERARVPHEGPGHGSRRQQQHHQPRHQLQLEDEVEHQHGGQRPEHCSDEA